MNDGVLLDGFGRLIFCVDCVTCSLIKKERGLGMGFRGFTRIFYSGVLIYSIISCAVFDAALLMETLRMNLDFTPTLRIELRYPLGSGFQVQCNTIMRCGQ